MALNNGTGVNKRTRTVKCRVCEYNELVQAAENHSDYKWKKCWLRSARAKKERVLKMYLRKSRWMESFCSEEHFDIAKQWYKEEVKFSRERLRKLKEKDAMLGALLEEDRQLYQMTVLRFITEPEHPMIKTARERYHRVAAQKGQSARMLADLIEAIELGEDIKLPIIDTEITTSKAILPEGMEYDYDTDSLATGTDEE